jgi:hypothetical protein
VQVLRDSAAQVRHLDIVVVVVELVEQMCGELLAAAPLISFRDHGVSLEYRGPICARYARSRAFQSAYLCVVPCFSSISLHPSEIVFIGPPL